MVREFPGGGSMASQSGDNILTQTPSENIKIHPDITQVFYHSVSDPILPYHALHTLKHGYLFLDTLLTFKYTRWKGGATFYTRWKSFGRSSII